MQYKKFVDYMVPFYLLLRLTVTEVQYIIEIILSIANEGGKV